MKRLSVIALAVAALAAAPAFAASSSSASIGPMSLQLFDLDPLDGVAPSITFNISPYGYDTYVAASAYQSNPYAYDWQGGYFPGPWALNAVNAAAGVSQAAASIGGAGMANGATLSASGSSGDFTANTGDSATYTAEANVHPNRWYGTSFTLTAKTLVLVSGNASVAADAAPLGPSGYWDYAYAHVWLNVWGPGASGSGSQSAYDDITVGGYAYGVPFSLSDARSLGASFVNLTSSDMDGYFEVGASVTGITYANVVPEPETYALMLAGLLTVGIITHRRRRR